MHRKVLKYVTCHHANTQHQIHELANFLLSKLTQSYKLLNLLMTMSLDDCRIKFG